MKEYTFICPLQGCAMTLSVHADDINQGAALLTVEAAKHLQEVHPDVHKSQEEVTVDVQSHMKEV